MQPITAPPPQTTPGPPAAHGRWIWVLSGTLTIAAIAAFGSWAIVRSSRTDFQNPTSVLPTRAVTVATPVSALNVQSYGAPIKVTTVPGGGPVTIAETITYSSARPPTVTHTNTRGLLKLAAPACANSDCSVAFSVTVPTSITVTAAADGGAVTVVGARAAQIDSGGGPVYAAGINGPLTVNAEGGGITVDSASDADLDSGGGPVTANGVAGKLTVRAEGGGVTVSRSPAAIIDSGGGPVNAAYIGGPLTVNAEGGGVTVTSAGATDIDSGGGPVTADTIRGPLSVHAEGGGVDASGVTGALSVDTGGGPLSANSLTSSTATVNGAGGGVTLAFTTAPASVRVDTGGGGASLSVPGGPYAVTADTGGSNESILISTSPGAANLINVSTDGGNLQIGPA